MKKYSSILFLFLTVCIYGQDIAFPKIVPPSPTAYELGKYGQIPVSLFTGTPNVSVPLYTYRTRNLSIPISLNYSSNGIQVDQLSSNVGLGWSFLAGGVITRIVRDKPDEDRGALIPEKSLKELGYRSPEAMAFFQAAGEEFADTETDLYMYNFLGHSGKFVFKNKIPNETNVLRGIIMMPQTDLKVDVISNGFKITTSDGIKYFFQEEEITSSRTYGPPQSPQEVAAVTAWYLTKIIHPKGDVIDFIYDAASTRYMYDANVTESIRRMTPNAQDGCEGYIFGSQDPSEIMTNRVWVTAKRLSKIKSNSTEHGEVLIESNQSHPEITSHKLISRITVKDKGLATKERIDLSYYSTPNDRILLNVVQFLDTSKKYAFEYYNPDEMPERLSKSVDHYGYYNGKTNNHRYPDPLDPIVKPYLYPEMWNIPNGADKSIDPSMAVNGLLKKVHYPTKGYNEFEYEANSYVGEITHYPGNTTSSLLAISNDVYPVEDSYITPKIGYDNIADIRYNVAFNTDCDENLDVGKNKSTLQITDDIGSIIPISRIYEGGGTTSAGNNFATLSVADCEEIPINNHLQFTLKKDRIYTLTLRTAFMCTFSSLNCTYSAGEPWTSTQNIPIGGLRIQRIKSFDTEASINPNNVMRYYYGKKETPNTSTGQQGMRPFYRMNNIDRQTSGCLPFDYRDIFSQTLYSNSIRQLYSSSDISTTSYKFVTISYGGDNFEGGGIENEYFIMPDVPGNPLLNSNNIDGAPWINSGWKNGLLKRETIFKKSETGALMRLQTKENTYIEDEDLFQQVYGYAVSKKYASSGLDVNYTCTQEDVDSYTDYTRCVADHKHAIWIPTGNCFAPGNDNRTFRLWHFCHFTGLGVVSIPDRVENLDIMEYSSNSYWFYQNSQIVTDYDEDGNPKMTTTTNYHYDNPEHLQPTRVVTTRTGDSRVLITKKEYPDDLPGDPYMGDIDSDGQYRIAEPVRVRTYQDNGNGEELLSTQKTVYDDFGGLYLPKAIQTAKGNDPLQNRLVYSSYDGYGNLREVSQPNGARTVYVMGYDFTLPVAKLENVAISEIPQSYLDDIYYESKFGTETTLLQKLDDLRGFINGLDKSVLVTTLTYLPLVGVHTVTDPKGYMMTYEYDDFGRLQYVKDMDDNILSENEYHYITD